MRGQARAEFLPALARLSTPRGFFDQLGDGVISPLPRELSRCLPIVIHQRRIGACIKEQFGNFRTPQACRRFEQADELVPPQVPRAAMMQRCVSLPNLMVTEVKGAAQLDLDAAAS